MKYKDEISAFKAGILKTCQDRGVNEDLQDGIMAYVEAHIKQADANADAIAARDARAYIASLPDNPVESVPTAGTSTGTAGKGWEMLGQFGKRWKDNPYPMLIESLPYMLGAGLIGAGIGGKKGFGIGGLLGLLGPLATMYGKKQDWWPKKTTTPKPADTFKPVGSGAVKPLISLDEPPNMARYPGDPLDYQGEL